MPRTAELSARLLERHHRLIAQGPQQCQLLLVQRQSPHRRLVRIDQAKRRPLHLQRQQQKRRRVDRLPLPRWQAVSDAGLGGVVDHRVGALHRHGCKQVGVGRLERHLELRHHALYVVKFLRLAGEGRLFCG